MLCIYHSQSAHQNAFHIGKDTINNNKINNKLNKFRLHKKAVLMQQYAKFDTAFNNLSPSSFGIPLE